MTENDFGEFGKPLKKDRSKFYLWLRLFLISALLPAAYVGWREMYVSNLERIPPTIEIQKVPKGIGEDPVKLRVRVTDEMAGLSRVVVRSDQGGAIQDLYKVDLDREEEHFIELDFHGRASGFEEGEVRLTVLAVDKSYSKNVAKKNVDILVDYEPPRVALVRLGDGISTTYRVGEVLFVAYRFLDKNRLFSWVTVGSELYPGFPARYIDAKGVGPEDLYFALAPIPTDFSPGYDDITLRVTDKVGNAVSLGLNLNVLPLQAPVRSVALPRGYIQKHILPLVKRFKDLQARDQFQKYEEVAPPRTDAEYVEYFRYVNEKFRTYTEEKFKRFFSRPKLKKYWKGRFSKFIGTKHRLPYGEKLNFTFEGREAGSSYRTGMFVTSGGKDAPVIAANSGTIVFADDLGIYGNTIIVDHGFGLASMYSQLSTFEHREGVEVQKGEIIGRMGRSGISSETGMLFEVRVHGIAVDPYPWLDKDWVSRHITRNFRRISN